jgi:hypothetical protein
VVCDHGSQPAGAQLAGPAGIARAREKGTKSGKPIGRALVDPKTEDAIRASLASGKGNLRTARECKVGSSTVQRVKRAMSGLNDKSIVYRPGTRLGPGSNLTSTCVTFPGDIMTVIGWRIGRLHELRTSAELIV